MLVAQSDWLTTSEAATYLKVKPRSLLQWTRLGKIRGHVLSGTKRRLWRFRREDLDSSLLSEPVVSCLAAHRACTGKEVM